MRARVLCKLKNVGLENVRKTSVATVAAGNRRLQRDASCGDFCKLVGVRSAKIAAQFYKRVYMRCERLRGKCRKRLQWW